MSTDITLELAAQDERRQHVRVVLQRTLIYGLLLVGAAIILIPFLWMISTSLKTERQLFAWPPEWIPDPVRFENYWESWERLSSIAPGLTFWRILGNTLFITILAMFAEMFSAAVVAYGFARFRFKGRDVIFFIMLATMMIPDTLTRVPSFLIWREAGLLNTYDPLTLPAWTAWGPAYVFLLRQFFLTIPREMEEAATIDGANTVQIFFYVMLPLVKPAFLAIGVMAFTGQLEQLPESADLPEYHAAFPARAGDPVFPALALDQRPKMALHDGDVDHDGRAGSAAVLPGAALFYRRAERGRGERVTAMRQIRSRSDVRRPLYPSLIHDRSRLSPHRRGVLAIRPYSSDCCPGPLAGFPAFFIAARFYDPRLPCARTALLLAVLIMLLAFAPRVPAQDDSMRDGLINLDHLLFLTEPVTFGDQDVAIVHIYSEYPEYEWVDAAGEGIAAVDDVARAALVYLAYYEQTGDSRALDQARLCLDFVRTMQTEDGWFYNFVTDAEGTINTQGRTSYKTLTGWWAARGLWALAEGYRVFADADPAYAADLQAAYLRTESALAGDVLRGAGTYSELHGLRIPAWIPGGAADSSSVLLLALTGYYRADPNPDTQALIEHIASGISEYVLGDSATYPFGMHPVTTNAPGYWHAWGSHMVHALAEAGAALNRQDWIDSAAYEAETFMMRQLAFENIKEIGILPRRLGQISYGTDMLVQGYMALYRATGEEKYAIYGGLAASWFFGNNMAGVPVYDPETGRSFDGIEGPAEWRINRNAGAESTIEALLALLVVHARSNRRALSGLPRSRRAALCARRGGNGYAGRGPALLPPARLDRRSLFQLRPICQPRRW